MSSGEDKVKQALNLSYRLLSYRPRSTFEIRTKLIEKGYAREVVSSALERLKELHYLDDEVFARFWVESRRKSKPVGTLLIERDLKKKGIDEGFIKEAIKTGETKHSEHDTALELARKRLDFYGKVHRLKAKRRIHDYLVRRGFKFDVISEVLSEVFV